MSKNNVRIAIRDSTDSHNVAFFDNKAGIKYKSANLHRFLAGSASILTIKYNSKDIDSIRSGCKLAFRYKNRDYWLNVMSSEKKGFEVELTAYSLGLELNNETRGEHKPANAMSIAEYVAYYDPEHALTIGVNEVSDKRIKLEWTGTDTILARLFSIANSFGAELDFNVELNDDYSLKRQVLNIYKKGNLGTNKVSQPVRVGKELKVINYSDNIKELRTAVRATGKDGLTIDGLNKKIYDNNKELLYYSSGMTVYAPQSRDRFPSVGKGSNDNWIVKDLGETQYETKEALWGYMYGEIQKISVPEITYEVEGAIDAGIGDTQTLIDDIHFEPALYVQARVSELEDDILTGKVTNSTFINFERKYSQIADSLLKQVEALAEDAAPYIVRLSTDNGYNFKNGQGTSTITAKLEKYSKIVNAKWKWLINNSVVSETSSVKINASQVNGTLNVVAVAIVGGNEAAREYITFTNADDGVGIKSITRYYTTNDQAEGVTAGGQNWSTKPTTVTTDKKYMWSYDVITYTNDTSLVTKPAVIGARGDDGLDADTTGITEALDKAKQELTALSANIEKVRNDSLAAVEEAKQQLTTIANDLSKAKTDLQNAVSEVDTKATNLKSDLSQAKQDLTGQAQQLQAQANAQSELTNRVSSVEKTADGTKTTVNELTKTVAQNGKDITSVTARTKTVEDDLSGTKTTLSQVQTTADSTSQKTATLESGLDGLTARFDNLKIGAVNLLHNSKGPFQPKGSRIDNYVTYSNAWINMEKGKEYTLSAKGTAPFTSKHATDQEKNEICLWLVKHDENINVDRIISNATTGTAGTKFTWNDPSGKYRLRVNTYKVDNSNYAEEVQIEEGNLRSTYSQNESDIESKVAEYKQTSDQNYANLQTTVQNLDGTVQANKTTAEQTAAGFKTRIESLETYKSGESTRANQYFESAKTETARQLTAERTAIAKDYVSKSTYTSDVTGIRNDLTATTTTANTTKTNLANYQASNDKAVANLQSNLQTANGNISSLQTKVEAVPGQITSAVSAVEGKIPTSVGGRNYLRGTSDEYQTYTSTNYVLGYPSTYRDWNKLLDPLRDKTVTIRAYIKNDTNYPVRIQMWFTGGGVYGNTVAPHSEGWSVKTGKMSANWTSANVAFTQEGTNPTGGSIQVKKAKLEIGNIPSDWSPAPEDAIRQISAVSSELKQTKDGMTLLATKTELNSAKTELQSGITTATNKANTAQNTANNNTKTISTHTTQISALNTGLSAKVSQTDFNTLSGRVTTAENNITAKANELSSKISSVEGKIPSGEMNLVEYGRPADGHSPYNNVEYATHPFYYNSAFKMYIIKNTTTTEKLVGMNRFKVERNTDYTLYFKGFNNSAITNMDVWFLKRVSGSTKDFDSAQILVSGRKLSTSKAEDVSVTFNTGNYDEGYIRFDNNGSKTAGTQADLFFGDVSVKKGKSNNGWSPSLAELASSQDLKNAQSEIKQTTDSIKASVSSLDKSTVKSASLTINTDGIVMKAGKSTTDVANAIGSYFAVNQNAINLFSDKINVKGSMIVDGAITSNKIASKSINTAHLNGKIITADVIATNAVTANAIKAGAVTTDKMIANSINGDRITAGTLDAAKIKAGSITASQIASGTITSAQIKTGTISAANIAAGAITTDKIAANSINSSKIVSSGITANVIKGGKLQSLSNATNFELDTGKLFYNNNNTGIFRVQANASTMGLKFSNTSITVSGTSRILSRVILGGDRRETSLDDGKWDQGGFTGIVAETINGVDSNAHSQADTLRVIGDNIYFTHSYNYDAQTKTSAQGWKMETFSPFSSYAGNVVLKPYGINYRQSDIITGDVRLDNGDGSGYWVRGCIRTLRNCFQHYLNGGTTSGAMNAIRDALREISGV